MPPKTIHCGKIIKLKLVLFLQYTTQFVKLMLVIKVKVNPSLWKHSFLPEFGGE